MSEINHVRIKDIFIRNYRSFSPEGELVKGFSGINIFVGPNGVGKSVFFNAIRYCIDRDSFNAQGTYDLMRNFNDPEQHIEIILNVDVPQGKPPMARLVQEPYSENPVREPNPEIEPFFKQRFFPIGFPRQFSVFNNPDHPVQYEHISENWKIIYQDAKKYLDISTFPDECPPKRYDDRIFFDLLDENGASLLEGSDGKAYFLFMIFSIRKWEPGSIITIEEPEIGMHPGSQKQFLNYLKELSEKENYQFLVSTHSPYLLNLAVTKDFDDISIFRLSKDVNEHTKIRRVKDHDQSWAILSDLGHMPADVLQANGIIWVEGPSDLIYLDVWIEKLADLYRGKDYEIMWYGGSNFVQLGTEDEQRMREAFWKEGETPQRLTSLFDINPNWAFIVDSDSDKETNKDPGVRERFRTINKNKDSFIEECKKKHKFTWKVDPYIEACVEGRRKRPAWKSKVEWAHEYKRNVMGDNSPDGNLSLIARKEVERLISTIYQWR